MRIQIGRRQFWKVIGVLAIGKLLRETLCAASGERKFQDTRIAVVRVGVRSSNIASIGYAAEAKVLDVEFRSGAIYRYFDVPASIAEEFLRALSKGTFFARKVRGKYDYERIGEAKR